MVAGIPEGLIIVLASISCTYVMIHTVQNTMKLHKMPNFTGFHLISRFAQKSYFQIEKCLSKGKIL